MPVVRLVLVCLALALLIWLAYPVTGNDVRLILGGAVSWLVGVTLGTWHAAIRLVLTIAAGFAILAIWAVAGAWQRVRRLSGPQARPWSPARLRRRELAWDTVDVAFAILAELGVTAVLVALFLLVIRVTAAILGVAAWQSVAAEWDVLASSFRQGLTIDAARLRTMLQTVGDGSIDWSAVTKGANVGGTLLSAGAGAAVSLLLVLLRRRRGHLSVARMIARDMATSVRDSLAAIPAIVASSAALARAPAGQRFITVTGEQRMMFLDPSTGQALRLPGCLLVAAVNFYNADQGMTKVYQALGGDAFAEADGNRRERYLQYLQEYWEDEFEPVAFSALFRFEFYARLRIWSL